MRAMIYLLGIVIVVAIFVVPAMLAEADDGG